MPPLCKGGWRSRGDWRLAVKFYNIWQATLLGNEDINGLQIEMSCQVAWKIPVRPANPPCPPFTQGGAWLVRVVSSYHSMKEHINWYQAAGDSHKPYGTVLSL